MTQTNFQLNDFQKKVFEEYKIIKSFRMGEDKINADRKKGGCLGFPLALLADSLIRTILRSEARKRNVDSNIQSARDLLGKKEIFDKVCETLTANINSEILTEEKFTGKLTEALYKSQLAVQYAIPENPVLYAIMAIEIFTAGIENFCRGQAPTFA